MLVAYLSHQMYYSVYNTSQLCQIFIVHLSADCNSTTACLQLHLYRFRIYADKKNDPYGTLSVSSK